MQHSPVCASTAIRGTQLSPAPGTHPSSPYHLLICNRLLFASTLQAYTESTGISLAEHPLALQLQNYHSVEAITALLQDQTQMSSNFGENARLEGSTVMAAH